MDKPCSFEVQSARIMAGIPAINSSFFWRIRFMVGDPAVWIEFTGTEGQTSSILLLRDIEMQRASKSARVDQVGCPADFTPESGLSGDRETATAQAAAECLKRAGLKRVTADRTMPMVYAAIIREQGIDVQCDLGMGVAERRSKDEQEIEWIREAQATTEDAMQMACGMIAGATAQKDGILSVDGQTLTAERVQSAIDVYLLGRGYTNPGSIVACGTEGADCHNYGAGDLRTGQPVIVDIFPQNRKTQYNGDCTRTVVHGDIPDHLLAMNRAVRQAKAAATAAVKAGVTGETVHLATLGAIREAGYGVGLPKPDSPDTYCAITHGTGHGVGLDVHEPPLLDMNGPALVTGDCITIEPGVYSAAIGGVRVEDIIVVTDDGSYCLNKLQEGLDWS